MDPSLSHLLFVHRLKGDDWTTRDGWSEAEPSGKVYGSSWDIEHFAPEF
jgi:hypothetical protein